MTHAELLAAIQLTYSRGNTRLFKINCGDAWAGTIVAKTGALITLADYRHIQMGAPGIADLIGFTGPYFAAIEAKTGRGRASGVQTQFLDLVAAHGGRAGIARSLEDAARILGISP
jgi:hypothetical protein